MHTIVPTRLFRCLLLTAFLSSMVTACTYSPPPSPRTKPTVSPLRDPLPSPVNDPVQSGIQHTLDRYITAYNHNDSELLQQLVDPSNPPFRRFVLTQFDAFQSSFQQGVALAPLHVRSIQPRAEGFVLAHIQSENGLAADWLFHKVDTSWLLSEPTVKQIGAPRKVVHGRFTFVTYPWADDVNETIISLMERAQQHVVSQLGKDAPQALTIELKPSYSVKPYEDTRYSAYYTPGRSQTGPDRIQLFTPNAYTFGFYDPDIGWEQSLEMVLTHEYTHMVHTRAFDNVGYLTTWIPEGLAEYVAQSPSATMLQEAIRQGTIIPIIDQQAQVNKQDLMHMTTLEKDRGLAYGFAHSVVQYIIEEHGGLPAFWSLASAYDETQNLDVALQKTLHLSYEEFDRGWREWLKTTF